jgi:hypothetical protein
MDSILGGLKTFYPEIGDDDPDKHAMALREGPYRLDPMVKWEMIEEETIWKESTRTSSSGNFKSYRK